MNAATLNALNAYSQTGVHSQLNDASPHRIIQMLLDGAISRIAFARGSMEHKDFAQKSRAISESMAIIVGLRSTLNFEQGGDVARQLNDLYAYLTRRLAEANRTNNRAILDEAAKLLGDVKQGWDAIPEDYRHMSSREEFAKCLS